MNRQDYNLEYPRLAHALQSGIAASIALDGSDATKTITSMAHGPKMLRTGVNMAMVELGAIGKLLIDKGLITKDEYRQALVDGLRVEVAKYEAELTERYGRPVSLG